MNHAHEVDIHHAPEQRRVGFCERRGFRDPGIGDQDIDRLAACGFRNRGIDGGLIRDVGDAGEMRGAGGNGVIQRRAVAAEHRDGRSGLRERGRDRAADASPAPGDERMGGTRQSGHARASRNEFDSREAYILDFKLLQEMPAAHAGMLDRPERRR